MPPRPRQSVTVAVAVLAVAVVAELVVVVAHRLRTPLPAPAVPSSAPAARAGPPASAAPGREGAPRLVATLDRARLREQFVGSAACAPCHAEQAAAYAKSHHAKALVPATPDNVPGELAGTSFSSELGGSTRFSEESGAFTVTSPGADGKGATFSLAYLVGVSPLQQFVVATERGKLQTLGVAWDSRATKDGGGRWFHVYGPRGIAPGDELYFTRPAQNFNQVCADCHATLVERRYDVQADAFATQWSEAAVGCEACHGPGAAHVRAAQAGAPRSAYAATLTVELEASAPWAPSASGSPTPRAPDTTELEVCAPCHSRREPVREGFVAGDPLLDAFAPELLDAGRYHADGQVEGEVYEWGSFLQSRMYAAGVRCSDCHEPHAGTLRAEGDALCTRCHEAARFAVPAHSHHGGNAAPHCIDCHLPPATFMQIDVRRDHSIRIPRPDLSAELGTPNACSGCHAKMAASSAAATLARWFPGSARGPHFASALAAERRGAPDAVRALVALAGDATEPSIARATALERLGHAPGKKALVALRAGVVSPDPLVAYGAALGAGAQPLAARASLLLPALGHPRRAVRVAAARALAELPPAALASLDGRNRAALERAFAEVEESFALGASRPEMLVEQSGFELGRGRPDVAESLLKTALARAPCLAAAQLNLADLARSRGDEATAEREIRAALACEPKNAFAHHALGLALIRAGDRRGGLSSLTRAVALAPNEARFSYVLAVAQAELGDVAAAVAVLTRALETNGNDAELLQTLADDLTKVGQTERAAEVRGRLAHLLAD